MNNIEDIKTLVKLLPFDEEVKVAILSSADEIMKFNKFISDKYTLTQKEAELKVQSSLAEMYASVNNDNVSADDAVEISSENAKIYANSEGYDRGEELKKSVISLSNALKYFTSQ